MAAFYCVLRDTDPRLFKHNSRESARDEAERLARKEGRRFYVLAADEHVQPIQPSLSWSSHRDGFEIVERPGCRPQ